MHESVNCGISLFIANVFHPYSSMHESVYAPHAQVFASEVREHADAVEALRKEGEGVKEQGGVEEARMVDRWVMDVASRWEDLGAAVEEREVGTCKEVDVYCCRCLYFVIDQVLCTAKKGNHPSYIECIITHPPGIH